MNNYKIYFFDASSAGSADAKPYKKRPRGSAILAVPGMLGLILPVIIAIIVPSMLGYVKKSKTSSAHATASTAYKAANTALVELDEKDIDVYGSYIISSDTSKNYNVDFDVDKFYETMDTYFSDIYNTQYFVVCEDGMCVFAAVIDSTGYVGTYDYDLGIDTEGKDLEELYEEALDKLY